MYTIIKILVVIILLSMYCMTSMGGGRRVLSEKPDLAKDEIIRAAAGVYINQTKSDINKLHKTIVVTSGNTAYIDFLQNFMCYAMKHGIKFLFAAMDKQAFDLAPSNHEYLKPVLMVNDGSISPHASGWRQFQFNHLTIVKLEVVYYLMKLGYDVLFFDTDIILLEDPIPFMVLSQYDYVHQVNEACPKTEFKEGNTGLYYVRSNNNTLKFFESLISIPREKRVKKVDDQTIFWDPTFYSKEVTFIRVNTSNPADVAHYSTNHPSNNVILAYPLDSCLFSIGFSIADANNKVILQQVLTSKQQKPIAVHANVMSGHRQKKSNVVKQDLWLVGNDWQCLDKLNNWFEKTYF